MAKVTSGDSLQINLESMAEDIGEKAQAILDKLPDCVQTLKDKLGTFESACDAWETFVHTTYTGESALHPGAAQQYKFYDYDNVQATPGVDSQPWGRFTDKLLYNKEALRGLIDQMPSAADLSAFKTSGDEATWHKVRALSHFGPASYLNLRTVDGYESSNADKIIKYKTIAGILLPQPMSDAMMSERGNSVQRDWRPNAATGRHLEGDPDKDGKKGLVSGYKTGYQINLWHPYIWCQDLQSTTWTTPGGGNKLWTSLSDGASKYYSAGGEYESTEFHVAGKQKIWCNNGTNNFRGPSTNLWVAAPLTTSERSSGDNTCKDSVHGCDEHEPGKSLYVGRNQLGYGNIYRDELTSWWIYYVDSCMGWFDDEGYGKAVNAPAGTWWTATGVSPGSYDVSNAKPGSYGFSMHAFAQSGGNLFHDTFFGCGNLRCGEVFNWWLDAGNKPAKKAYNNINYITKWDACIEAGFQPRLFPAKNNCLYHHTEKGTDSPFVGKSSAGVAPTEGATGDEGWDWDSTAFYLPIKPFMNMTTRKNIMADGTQLSARGSAQKGKFFGTGNGAHGQHSKEDAPITHLYNAYTVVRKAAIELREAAGCIVQLDTDLYLAEEDAEDFAKDVQDLAKKGLTTPEEDKLAQQILDQLAQGEEDLFSLTPGFTKSLIFKEQCFLLAKIFDIAEFKTGVDLNEDKAKQGAPAPFDKSKRKSPLHGLDYVAGYKRAPYLSGLPKANACLLVDGDPYGFINRLTQNENQKYLFRAENWDISTLQPQIRLFKALFDESTGEENEIEVEFDSFANKDTLADMLTNKKRRGFGVGIQNFEFTFDGSNPFAAKKSIKATLKIFANSFDELLLDRIGVDSGGNTKKYKYVDLALKTWNNAGRGKTNPCYNYGIRYENEEIAKLNFRLKAVVGWAPPQQFSHMTPQVKDAIYDSYITLNLTPTVHDFAFDEQGRVVLTINYLAYVDDFLDQKLYNIFSDPQITYSQIMRELTYKNLRRQCKSDDITALKEGSQQVIGEEKRKSVSYLVNRLLEKDRIYYIHMSMDEVRYFMSKGPFYEIKGPAGGVVIPQTSEQKDASLASQMNQVLSQYEQANPDESLKEIRASLTVTNPNQADVAFFYVSDLIDIILESIDGNLPLLAAKMADFKLEAKKKPKKKSGTERKKELRSSKRADREQRIDEQMAMLMEHLENAEDYWGAAPADLGQKGYDECLEMYSPIDEQDWTLSAEAAILAGNTWVETGIASSAEEARAFCNESREAAVEHWNKDKEAQLSGGGFDLASLMGSTDGQAIADLVKKELGRETLKVKSEEDVRAIAAAMVDAEAEIDVAHHEKLIQQELVLLAQFDEYQDPYQCDLSNKAYEISRLQQEFKKFRVVLGPLEIIDYKDDIRTKNITLGDLPISVKYFIEWLTEKLSKKEESIYTIGNFLNDFFNNLVRNFLNDDTCFQTNIKQKVRVNQAAITSYKNSGDPYDEITRAIKTWFPDSRNPGRISLDKILAKASGGRGGPLKISGPQLQPGGNGGFTNEIKYLVYSAGRTQPLEKMKGDRISDEKAGIFHYGIGKDKGFIKNIQLSKTQTPGLQEVRFEQEGFDGLEQLRVVYDVNIDSYANIKTFPGTYIFIDPVSFAPTTNHVPGDLMNMTEYGIGGYYMIIRSTHTFGPGQADSKIFAKWVNQIEAETKNKEAELGSGANKKCN